MIWGGFGAIGIVRFPLLPSPSGRREGMRESSAPPSSQREKGRGASLPLRRPVYVVGQRVREKLRVVAGRVDNRPRALAGKVLIFARSAQERDVATFGPFKGHENLVAVAVRLDACAGVRIGSGPRLRFLHAADRKIVEKLRPVARLHNAGAFGGRI